MTKIDQVRTFLNSKQTKRIEVTDGLADIAYQAGFTNKESFYQVAHRLQSLGEIEIETEKHPSKGYKTVTAIIVKKLESTGAIVEKTAERMKSEVKPKSLPKPHIPNVTEYIIRKNAFKDAKKLLESAGVEITEQVESLFIPEPMAEEALYLLDLCQKAQDMITALSNENSELKIDLDAANTQIKNYQKRNHEETQEMLANGAK